MENITNLGQEHEEANGDTLANKRRKASCSGKENVVPLESNRTLAQRARRERERQQKSITLQSGLENTHAADIRGEMKMVEHHSCIPGMPYVPPVSW
ncbi:hypothetical protein Dimus_038132 [Dionaea muscipula]